MQQPQQPNNNNRLDGDFVEPTEINDTVTSQDASLDASAREVEQKSKGRLIKFLASTVTLYLRFGLITAATFLITPYIIQCVGQEDFGLWMLILCIVGYFELCDMGLATATVRFIGQYQGSGDVANRNRLASTLLVAYSVIGLVVAVAALGLVYFLPTLFSIPEAQHEKARWVAGLLSVRAVINMPLSLFAGILFGQQRGWILNVSKSLCYIFYGGSVWLFMQGGDVVLLAGINSLIFILEEFALFAVCKFSISDLRIRWGLFDRHLLREVFSYSMCALLTNVTAIVLLRTDPIVVKFFFPLSAVAIYAVAMKVAEQTFMLTKQFINAFSPIFAELFGQGDQSAIRRVFLVSTKFALAGSLPLAIPLVMAGDDLVAAWVGEEFRFCGPLLIILAIALVVKVLQETAENVLSMTGSHRFIAINAIVDAVSNVVLSVVLAMLIGMEGIAISTLLCTAFYGVAMVVRKTCQEFDVSAMEYIRHSILPMIGPAAIQVIAIVALQAAWTPGGLIELGIQTVALSALCFGVAFLVMSVNETELEWLSRKFPFLKRFANRGLLRSTSRGQA